MTYLYAFHLVSVKEILTKWYNKDVFENSLHWQGCDCDLNLTAVSALPCAMMH